MAYRHKKHHTLCYYCQKATRSGCRWSRDLQPVNGWQSKKTSVGIQSYKPEIGYYTEYVDSYDVYRCPEFVEHELCHTDPEWIKELAMCLSFPFKGGKDGV